MAAFLVSGCQSKPETFFETSSGGDPIAFQHFIWFIGHPEIFLPLLLIFAICVFLLLRRLSPRFAAFCSRPIDLKFSIPRLWIFGLVVMVFLNVILTILGSRMFQTYFDQSMAFHDTYYVVAHFHYILTIACLFLLFAMLYWLFAKLTQYKCHRGLAVSQFGLFFTGVSLILLPQHFIGLQGMPRRYYEAPDQFSWLNTLSTLGAILCLISAAAFFIVIIEALVKKRPIGDRVAPKKSEPS